MQEYYFLFSLAFIFTLFAVIQDLKSREVANWLNFSLIAFALSYRAFYAITNNNLNFFLVGLAGFALFFILAHALYYTQAFAGGDAKLLMGYGAIIPFQTFSAIIPISLIFIFSLFAIGAVYSIIFSLTVIIPNNKAKFRKEFKKRYNKNKSLFTISIITLIISIILIVSNPFDANSLFYSAIAILALLPIVFVYTKSLESALISLTPPKKLTEGDWILNDIKLAKNKLIKKTIHGLTKKDIQLLKKYNKSVLVKSGIPFTPAFLITLLVTVYAFLVLKLPLSSFLPSF
jgi:Flp pilus assembly protein protease CpaA